MYPEEFVDDFRRYKSAMDNTRYGSVRKLLSDDKIAGIVPGDKLICVIDPRSVTHRFENYHDVFTKGKIYKIVEGVRHGLYVIGDNNQKTFVPDYLFEFHSKG